jgi:uncharacterized protein (TIGR04168 family)
MEPLVSTCNRQFRLGVVGDLHTHWDEVDLAQFAGADYDLLFFTGDLGGGNPESSLRMARLLSRLVTPTLIMPGNNDTFDISQLSAELNHQHGIGEILALTGRRASRRAAVQLCGYSHHLVTCGDTAISLIAARPHSMGGPALSFPEYMAATYGIGSLEDSEAKLCELVDEAASERVLFLAHNGPTGLGAQPDAMWGCDFKPGGGDWGDTDLATAMQYASQLGKTVLGMVGGHMHLRTKQGNWRPWQLRRDGALFINASRVPRIFSDSNDVYRHHIALTIDGEGISAEEVLWPQYGGTE